MTGRLRSMSFAAAALALLGAAVFWGGGAFVARRVKAKPPVSATLVPETVPRPGDAAGAQVVFELPWGNAVTAAQVEAGKDLVVSGPTEISSKLRWGYRIWRVGATLRPLGTAGAAPGKLVVTLEKPLPGSENDRCEFVIPEVRVAGPAAAAVKKPRLAGPETPERNSAKWWLVPAAAVVLLAAAGYFVWRGSRRARPAPTPWEIAFSELAGLDADMKKSGFRTETGVWKLSDILRNYLARRFGIDAVTAADREFLAADAVRKLAREDREFLNGFFAAASLVKFARVPADPAELERSLAAARELVGRTVPPPEPDKKTEAAS